MARRKKRKDGYLRKSFTFHGKRYYVYGRTAEELLSKEIEKRAELEQDKEKLVNPTLTEYSSHFTAVRRAEIKESTIRSQKIQFNVIANVVMAKGILFGSMRLKEITRRNIEDARQILLNEGKTPQYLNNCFSHLNHVFNTAYLDDTIDKNPCKALKQLKRDAPLIGENKHRALSEDETIRFFNAAKDANSYYLNAFLIMAKTGMRIGEVAGLYETDIDRKNGFIHVRRTVVRSETGDYRLGENTKTQSGARDIPLTGELYSIIREQVNMNHMLFGLKLHDMIFKSVEGNIIREYSVNREIKRICKSANIDVFTCHAFRNTFATRFIEQRPQDYKILSEILGHKDVKITLNLYTHVMTENKVAAMQELMIKTS